jgi:ABC-type antimicrobial peptide transport system permease subunit
MLYYAVKELLKRYRSYLLNVIVISLVTAMVITLSLLGMAYKEAARLPFKDIQGTIIVQKNGNVPENVTGVLLSCSLAPIHQDSVTAINKIDGAQDISSALSLWVFDPDHFKRVLGVNWQDSYGKSLSSKVIEGATPATDREILVDKTYAGKNDLSVGSNVAIAGSQFTVSGIIGMAGNEIVAADVYLNLAVAQNMAYQSKNLQAVERVDKNDVNVIFVNAGQQDLTLVTQKIKQSLSDQDTNAGQTPLGQTIGTYNIYTPDTFENQISTILKLSDQLTWVISLVLFIGACLIIARNTLRMVLERRKEFGVLKSVGYTGRDIQKLIGIETILQVLAGFVGGLLLTGIAVFILSKTTVSIAIPWELSAYPHFLLANPEDANVVQTHFLPIGFNFLPIIVAFLGVLIVGLVTALLSTWQINKLKPMEILKYE